VVLPDINILVYALDKSSPHHRAAREWWEEQLNGTQTVCLPWVVMLGLIRLLTNPRVFNHPYEATEVLAILESWLALPHVRIIHPSDGHFELLGKMIGSVRTAGNLTTDIHLAALAIERGLVLCSADTDFSRFPGLKWKNPLKRKRS
jgi:toxin-antitoxin system PIN domain toxin